MEGGNTPVYSRAAGSANASQGPLTDKEKLADLEESGAIFKLDRSNTLAGPDSNANGVQDDVETCITKNYTQPAQRAAAMQIAKSMPASLMVDSSNLIAIKEVNRQASKADHCLLIRFNGGNSSRDPAQVGTEI